MNTVSNLITVPLSQLRLSPKNSRKRRSPETIAAIAESLKVHGQLQNLVVTGPSPDGIFDVDAGGTRLLAFQLRQERGELEADHPVECKVVEAADALAASTAENTLREAMHPADQFRAFKRMVDDGRPIEEVGAHFSTPVSVVTQRLKLANVAEDLFALYDQGAMKLDQLQALALTDDHAAQRQAWFGTKGAKIEHDWQRRAGEIRKRITAKEIGSDNPLVKFVGAEAYEAAGGAVRRDFFSSDFYFSDAKLLEQLARAKLEKLAEQERAAGWAWVETHLQLDYSDQSRYPEGPFRATYAKQSAEDKARMTQIEARLEAINEAEDDAEDDDLDALEREGYQLRNELEDLHEGRATWAADAKAKTGVLIYIDRHEGLQIDRGRLQPGQRVSAGNVAGEAKEKGKPKKPELSFDMVARLNLHRSAACRRLLVDQPAVALQLLTAHLVGQLIDRSSSLFEVNIKNVHRNTSTDKFPDLAKADARVVLQDLFKATIPPMKAAEILPWVQKLTAEQLQKVHALVAALSLDNLSARELGPLADQLGLNMADWWEADGPRYLSNVPKALILEAVTEVRGKDAAAKIANLKKDAVIAEAGKLLAGTGWLPKPLRGSSYALAGAKKQVPAVAAAAKKTAAKAPGKKAAPKTASKKVASKRAPKKATKKR